MMRLPLTERVPREGERVRLRYVLNIPEKIENVKFFGRIYGVSL